MSQTNAIASINSLLLQLPEALQIEALHYVESLKQRIAISEVDGNSLRETLCSAVDTFQLRGLDTQRFVRKLGTIESATMTRIAAAIALVVEYQA
jgi:PemK-like, MazF-like toxin of type II toxin-antitoxin system